MWLMLLRLTVLMLTFRLHCVQESPLGSPSPCPSPSDDELHPQEPTSQSPSRASSSSSTPPPPAHTPELGQHAHTQKVQKGAKIITNRPKPFDQLNNTFPTGHETADFRCTRRPLIILGSTGQKYWIFCEKSKITCVVLNSTDGEIAERENNMKKVLKEKGKRLSGSESRWFHSNSYVSGGVLTLFFIYEHTLTLCGLTFLIHASCLISHRSSCDPVILFLFGGSRRDRRNTRSTFTQVFYQTNTPLY